MTIKFKWPWAKKPKPPIITPYNPPKVIEKDKEILEKHKASKEIKSDFVEKALENLEIRVKINKFAKFGKELAKFGVDKTTKKPNVDFYNRFLCDIAQTIDFDEDVLTLWLKTIPKLKKKKVNK